MSAAAESGGQPARWIGLAAAGFAALVLQAIPAPQGLSREAWVVVALAAAMLILWVSEAIPIAVTALMPLIVLPLAGVSGFREAAAPYADPILYLFIGGFMLAAAIERWNLHARIALAIAGRAGASPRRLTAGFMGASLLLSMWISNTATTLMLIPIALGVVRAVTQEGEERLLVGGALVLGIAHAASIGGVGTPVGSPTNMIAIGFFQREGISVSFLQWAGLTAPLILIMAPLAWFLLTRPLPRQATDAAAAHAVIAQARAALGPLTAAEVRVACVFGAVALAWMTRPLLADLPGLAGLTDAGVALLGAAALFLLPAGPGKGALLDWPTAERIPWGIVILFGGGLSLAAAMEATGLSGWIGEGLQVFAAAPLVLVVAVLVVATILVSEFASNVATLTSMLPIVAALAAGAGLPFVAIAAPVAVAASFAFMLPIATAPNAIAYGTGLIRLRRMLTVGLFLNLAAIILITSSAVLIAPSLFPIVGGELTPH